MKTCKVSSNNYKILRVCIYMVELFLLFSACQVPGLIMEIKGGRPIMIIPFFLAVSLFEGNYLSICFVFFCGAVADLSFGKYPGFNLAIMGILGYLLGKVTEKTFEINFLTFIFCCIIAEPLLIFANFYLNYWDYTFYSIETAVSNHLFSNIIYTLLVSPFIYLFNRPIWYFINEKGGV